MIERALTDRIEAIREEAFAGSKYQSALGLLTMAERHAGPDHPYLDAIVALELEALEDADLYDEYCELLDHYDTICDRKAAAPYN
jgi:hypothetical protein